MAVFIKNLKAVFSMKKNLAGKKKKPGLELSADEMALKDAFDSYDKNKNGVIEKEELSSVLEKYLKHTPTPVQLSKIMKRVDLNMNGVIEFDEFQRMMKDRSNEKNEYKEVFKSYDKNKDGYITHDELFSVLQQVDPNTNTEEVEEIIKLADKDQNGKLDFAEFLDFFI